ncbi:alpha/beta hydrolase fold domain-containing protein [Erysipelothrix sp. D19-032]
MFGNRDDLPQDIRDYWHQHGYDIIAIDYPLAPEATLDDIIKSLRDTIRLCIDTDAPTQYSFFGRSAGAFLAFQLHRYFAPEFIIAFYGYTISDRQWLLEPNKHYMQYPTLNPTSLTRMIQTIPPYRSTVESRYALYVNARQTGTWLQSNFKPHPHRSTQHSCLRHFFGIASSILMSPSVNPNTSLTMHHTPNSITRHATHPRDRYHCF